MIDTLAKRAASSRFALGGCGIRPPSGTFSQIERGYTLGLYTFTFVVPSGIYLGQVVCYSQTVVVNRNTVSSNRNSLGAI